MTEKEKQSELKSEGPSQLKSEGPSQKKDSPQSKREQTFPVEIPVPTKTRDQMMRLNEKNMMANRAFMAEEEKVVEHRIELKKHEARANEIYGDVKDTMDQMTNIIKSISEAHGYEEEKFSIRFDFRKGVVVIEPINMRPPMRPPM